MHSKAANITQFQIAELFWSVLRLSKKHIYTQGTVFMVYNSEYKMNTFALHSNR